MDQYPRKVLEKIKILDNYIENRDLNEFNILHKYPKELAYPDGYYDSRFFHLIGFNTIKMEKSNLGNHDGIFYDKTCLLISSFVFADGSFMLKFNNIIEVFSNGQAVHFKGVSYEL